ncbi:MAG: hypothetical protein PHW53_02760 [Patescibacteria group bacterium]|nr:hypothetical protein [Patescibacteria group bacterium]
MSKKPEILINELFLESATNRQCINRVFNFEIPPGAAHEGGSIFGIIKIDSIHPAYERLTENFIDGIEKFYQEEHGIDFGAEFEKSLQATNKNITDFISKESNPVDLKKLNILIAACSGTDLSFSAIGQNKMMFFQKQDGKGYRVFDLTKNVQSDPDNFNPVKIFENVMYGSIQSGDAIIISNSELAEAFPEERLLPIVTAKKPVESVEYLRNELLHGSLRGGYTAIIIQHYEELIPVGTEAAAPKNFRGSLEHLKATTAETDRYLLGGGTGFASKIWAGLTAVISRLIPIRGPKYEEKIAPTPRELPRSIAKFFIWIGAITLRAIGITGRFFKNLFFIITNFHGKRAETIASYKSDAQETGDRSVGWFSHLGKKNKSVFIIALILVLLFAWSLIYLNYRKHAREDEAVYNNKVIEITQIKDEAESTLIYGDEERTRELVSQALSAIQSLPEAKRDQREIKQGLLAQIDILRQELRHEVIPNDLEKVADMPLSAEGQTINFRYLLRNADKTLILSGAKELYVWRDDANAWQEVDWENADIQSITAIYKSGDNSYLVFDQRPGASEIDVAGLSWRDVPLAAAAEQKSFIDAAGWNSNIYVLDTTANQIFKQHRSPDSGLAAGAAWIKTANVNLSDAVAITIDGSIYALKSNGEIYKFYTGEKQSWSATTIDPALTGATQIWTTEGTDNIFILDPAGKRVVVLAKDGKLKTQYLLNDLQNIKSFYIDRTARQIWVLADNGVWNFGFSE